MRRRGGGIPGRTSPMVERAGVGGEGAASPHPTMSAQSRNTNLCQLYYYVKKSKWRVNIFGLEKKSRQAGKPKLGRNPEYSLPPTD
jgi:hypothetical protein